MHSPINGIYGKLCHLSIAMPSLNYNLSFLLLLFTHLSTIEIVMAASFNFLIVKSPVLRLQAKNKQIVNPCSHYMVYNNASLILP